MRKCPHGKTRNDKTVGINHAQKAGCKYYKLSKYQQFCWRYRVGLDHCNRVDIPLEKEKEEEKKITNMGF
jgi:hypothetical protein